MSAQPKFYGSPIAATFETMRTVRQMSVFYALERQGVDVEEICKELLGCEVAQLSIKSASFLIGYLKGGGR